MTHEGMVEYAEDEGEAAGGRVNEDEGCHEVVFAGPEREVVTPGEQKVEQR